MKFCHFNNISLAYPYQKLFYIPRLSEPRKNLYSSSCPNMHTFPWLTVGAIDGTSYITEPEAEPDGHFYSRQTLLSLAAVSYCTLYSSSVHSSSFCISLSPFHPHVWSLCFRKSMKCAFYLLWHLTPILNCINELDVKRHCTRLLLS